jgi:MFS family permease
VTASAIDVAGAGQPPANRWPVYGLLTANAVSAVGNMLTSVTIPWLVLEMTGSAARTGVSGFFAVLPLAIAGLFGGTLVDRIGFRTMSVVSDVASGVTVAAIPLLHLTIGLAYWQLLVLVFLSALLDTPGGTARQSLIPDLARLAEMPFERANALGQSIPRIAILVGPALAGLLIATLGTHNVLWLDAVSFAISAALVAGLVPRDPPRESAAGRYVDELRAGGRYLREQPMLLWLICTFAALNLLLDPIFAVVLPVYAEEHFGSAVRLGLMVATFGGGTIAGVVAYGIAGPRLPRRPTLLATIVMAGLPIWPLALVGAFPVVIAALFVMGASIGPISPIVMTILHERVPAEFRGRTFGAMTAIASATIPLGIVITGFAIELLDLRATLLLLAIAYIAVAASAFVNPAFRQMNQPADSVTG